MRSECISQHRIQMEGFQGRAIGTAQLMWFIPWHLDPF